MKKVIKYLFLFTLICAVLTLVFVFSKIFHQDTPVAVPPDAENIIEVPRLCQNPELPSGCEATSAVMVLRFYGDEVRLVNFAEDWLGYEEFYKEDGKRYGPDPNVTFAGNPFSDYAYGCYAPAIVRAINENSSICIAEEIRGSTLEELCQKYIEKDKPILIWVTMDMKDSVEGNTWYFEDGTEFTWTAKEHCMVLMGYDEDYYFFNDPESGNALAYHKAVVEEKFKELGSQAVYIDIK